jgi:hypothetical protein
MNRLVRSAAAAVCALVIISFSHSAAAQPCPTSAPYGGNTAIRYSGTSCSSSSPTQPCVISGPVTFSLPADYTPQTCDSVTWYFGDGGTANTTGSNSPTHTYQQTGVFSVQASVSNSAGARNYYGSVRVSSTAGCPTNFPPTSQITYSGGNCSSQIGQPCAVGQPITFVVSPYFSSTVLESCNVATLNFGDGSSATLPAGTFTTTHTYASAGTFNVNGLLKNDFGSASAFSVDIRSANGILSLTPPQTTTAEGSVARFQVTRASSAGTVSVNYNTVDDSAIAGRDYTAASGTVTFANGETVKNIDVSTIDDAAYNGSNLSFLLSLSAPTSGYIISYSYTPRAYIADNDIPTISFAQNPITVPENGGSATITLNRTGDSTKVVSVHYSVQNPCCGINWITPVSNSLVFAAGETTKTFTVGIVNDDLYSGFRSLTMQLDNPNGGTLSGGNYYYSVPLNITEDEPVPTLTVQNVSVPEGNVPLTGTIVPVTISLSGKMTSSLFFSWTAANGSARSGSDYTSVSFSNLTIPAGSTSTTVTVSVLGDTIVEPDETFTINLRNVTIPDCCRAQDFSQPTPLTVVPPGTVTIINDDAAISPTVQSVAKGSTGTILLDIGQGPAAPLTIPVISSAPSIASVPSSVTIQPGFPRVEIPVTAASLGDATISVTLPPTFGGATVTSTVTVYQGANLVFEPKSLTLIAGQSATVKVSAQPALAAPLFVALSALNSAVIEIPASVVIEPGQSTTFTVKALKIGATSVRAQLPPQNGAVALFVGVEVIETPSTPALTRVQPSSGPTAGGTNVTIDGAKLSPDCTLSFGGASATNVSFVSADSLTATTPAHSAGAVDLVLNCSGATYTLTNAFTYVSSSATISGVTPSFGSTDGGTYVRIAGSNFAPGCWPFFDGNPARGAVNKSSSEIIATSAGHAAGTVDVSLRCGASTAATLANAFTYNAGAEPSPVITSVDPLSGSSGQSVTVNGARFAAGDRVTFDTTTATTLSFAPDALIVRVPDLPLGKISVTVTDSAGHASTTGPIFSVTEPFPPQITSAAPTTLRGGGELTLDGNAFRPGYSFAIGDAKSTTISMTYKRVVIRVPEIAAGNYPVNILNAAGQVASVGPTITISSKGVVVKSITPGCATSDGGIAVTIAGSGFETGAGVTFDGIAATNVKVVDAQTMTATLPAGTPGSPVVMVTNANGDRGTLTGGLQEFSPLDPNGICGAKHRGVRH